MNRVEVVEVISKHLHDYSGVVVDADLLAMLEELMEIAYTYGQTRTKRDMNTKRHLYEIAKIAYRRLDTMR